MAQEAPRGGEAQELAHDAHEHPSTKIYWIIGAILTVITAAEVWVFYIEALSSVLVPLLLVLSAAKFILVVMFFMHLKFDSSIFSGVFLVPLALAMLVIISLFILFQVLPAYYPIDYMF